MNESKVQRFQVGSMHTHECEWDLLIMIDVVKSSLNTAFLRCVLFSLNKGSCRK